MKGAVVSALCLFAALHGAGAQALYKVIAPDGRVAYTDRLPSPAEGRVVPLEAPRAGTGEETALPAALREAVERFPVTLYTAPECAPCTDARAWLRQRGVPHRERTVETDADREAWIGIVGGPEAPALRVGGEVVRGFAPARWQDALDAAGYRRGTTLPAGWIDRPALPLVERAAVPAEARAAEPLPIAAPGTVVPAPADPGAIRF